MTTAQPASGVVALRDRVFRVKRAEVTHVGATWCIEVETEGQEFDQEHWAPYLYHQGLRVDASDAAELLGRVIRWRTSSDPSYGHPEIGTMYVFGHHDVRDCEIVFGELAEGRIELTWTGTCDVFWSGEFMDNVPFRCRCSATVIG